MTQLLRTDSELTISGSLYQLTPKRPLKHTVKAMILIKKVMFTCARVALLVRRHICNMFRESRISLIVAYMSEKRMPLA